MGLRNILLNVFFYLIFVSVFAQNLVSNPSFEQTENCLSKREIDSVFLNIPALQMAKAKDWSAPSKSGTPDIFQTCFDSTNGKPEQFGGTMAKYGVPTNSSGWQMPRSGKNYVGIYAMTNFFKNYNYREYLSGKLIESLKKGKTYTVTFWCNLSDRSNLASQEIGLYFSKKSIKKPDDFSDVIHVKPQIQNPEKRFLTNQKNWVKVSAKYQAKGGEKFILIGNFKPYQAEDYLLLYENSKFSLMLSASAYYFIDDVCVSENETDCYSMVKDTLDVPENRELIPFNPAIMRIRGFVYQYDMFDKKPVKSNVSFLQNNKIIGEIMTTKNGKFEYLLDTAETIFGLIEHPDFFPKMVHFSNKIIDEFETNLIPLEKGKSSSLLHYSIAKNGVHHVPYAVEELEVWAKFLRKNPTMKIKIKSYGLNYNDKKTNPDLSAKENEKIWNRLALFKTKKLSKEIANKLIGLGVSSQQIEYEGYGNTESFTIYKNEIEWIDTIEITENQKVDSIKSLTWDFEKLEENAKITLENIYFHANSAELTLISMKPLEELAEFMKANPSLEIAVYGHTDNGYGKTSAEYLLELSEKRAESVKTFLVKKGVEISRLKTKGFGMTKPVADNKSEEGKRKNRRTEFLILKK